MSLSRSLEFREKETKAIFLREGFFKRTRNKVGRLYQDMAHFHNRFWRDQLPS